MTLSSKDVPHAADRSNELAALQGHSILHRVVGHGMRFARCLAQRVARRIQGTVERQGEPVGARLRVLFVANSYLPTLQLSFTRPLQPFVESGDVAWELLADIQLSREARVLSGGARRWAARRIRRFRPQLVVFCRYSGAHAKLLTEWARVHQVPTIYHLDDDLLNIPAELGPAKYAFHNDPARVAAVRHLLQVADVVYCSTAPLLERIQRYGIGGRGLIAGVHCPGEVLRGPPHGGPVKIGYMGIDHAHDFRVALPGLVRILERHPGVCFEIFGPIPKPMELERFGERVTVVPYVRCYDEFLSKFAALGWAVGICPLADTPFNHTKANNKWVEYTAVGAAVVATAGMLYDKCCEGGCGLLASNEAEWECALESLLSDPARRLAMVAAAQDRLVREYSPAALRDQVWNLFQTVVHAGAAPASTSE